MDPSTCLDKIREAVNEYQEALIAGDRPKVLAAATTLADHFAALDQWLSHGGFLPQAWHRAESKKGR